MSRWYRFDNWPPIPGIRIWVWSGLENDYAEQVFVEALGNTIYLGEVSRPLYWTQVRCDASGLDWESEPPKLPTLTDDDRAYLGYLRKVYNNLKLEF